MIQRHEKGITLDSVERHNDSGIFQHRDGLDLLYLMVCSIFISCNSQKKQRLLNLGVICGKHSWRC